MKNKTVFSFDGQARPFLRWAGGKQRLLSHLMQCLPRKYNNYYEPFLGGGSLFFALEPRRAYLSDVNDELINAYKQIKNNNRRVGLYLKKMKYDKHSYYEIRAEKPRNKYHRAARFVYLNRTCWNGLYRENRMRKFNVPYGGYRNLVIFDEKNLELVSRALKSAVLKCVDFEDACKSISKGDFVYFDPPYSSSFSNNGFLRYNPQGFTLDDQKRLSCVVNRLSKMGCYVLMSNGDHPLIHRLYKKYSVHIVERKCLIAGIVKNRKRTKELIISNIK